MDSTPSYNRYSKGGPVTLNDRLILLNKIKARGLVALLLLGARVRANEAGEFRCFIILQSAQRYELI